MDAYKITVYSYYSTAENVLLQICKAEYTNKAICKKYKL